MAAGVLSAPGSKYGPCEDETCVHRDCAHSRLQAATICPDCKEPIGYERAFYTDPDFDPQTHEHLVHEVCLLERYEP